jgi:hypothetical protein
MRGRPKTEGSWRDLAAQLRERGLARQPDDTRASMEARLRRADGTAPPLRLVLALSGASETLDQLAPAIARFGGRRVAPDLAVVSSHRLFALRRVARRRLGARAIEPLPGNLPAEPSAAQWAAARLVESLAETFGWSSALLPRELRLMAPLTDARAAQQGLALLRGWLGALDAQLDPLAEEMSEPAEPGSGRDQGRLRALLEEAIAAGRCVRLVYQARERGKGGGAITRRTVEPRSLEAQGAYSYLRAFCRWRGAERLFRLDRIREAVPLPDRVAGPSVVCEALASP